MILTKSDEEYTIYYNKHKYSTNQHPTCPVCKSNLKLKIYNPKNIKTNKCYKIVGCMNVSCETHNMTIWEKYKLFLPDYLYLKLKTPILSKSRYNVNYWVNKGFSEDEAKIKISEIQSENSKQVKNRYCNFKSKEVLVEQGLSIDEIETIYKDKSRYCKTYWINKGFSEDEAKIKISEIQSKNSNCCVNNRINNPNCYTATTTNQLGYWINKGFSEDEAKRKIKERQTTFSLKKCVDKFGYNDGLNHWKNRQTKWLKSYKKNNYSQISQKLFWDIYNNLPNEYKINDIYFATLPINNISGDTINNEYRLILNEKTILPDFYVKQKQKIIEFDGTYYHKMLPESVLKDQIRDEIINNNNHTVLHILEEDYKTNPEIELKKCLDYLLYR